MNLNRIDLNLFAVFDAIYTAGSLTKAADVLCITQPAVSNSLARLREMLNDPLFVRTGHSMTPTPVAQNIIGPAREALGLLRKSVQESHVFDPSTAQKAFNFASRDLLEVSIMPRLMSRLQSCAPNITLTNYEIARTNVVSAMASGSLDFFADASAFTDPHLLKQKIAEDRFVVMARKNHPELKNGLTLDTFLKLGHINVSHRKKGAGPIDIELDKMGKKRKEVMRGQHFLTVPSAIVKTDLIACLPYHLAKHYDLAIYEMPFELPKLEYFLYWHVSADHDYAHMWMREQIQEVAKTYNH
ncbi:MULTISPECIES: LysR family transcriptional regulator [Alteromonadaceae]|jgi:DNA-binding transcriptional LysR family regulator|uniref:LysR family transcriptional regulator n=1 Tax=Brumicola blandensis TaxID=3075611 RepID=A0AAW8R267_9ALTE|nr:MULTISPECIES: LysR family transcriptional regulator [unclassified Alteromonas]MDT0581248.1 LysR family transcriptional regulator [Alteromonas sp. W409]MDT0626865.1 LysR family transcriptional regulator [Alteromonas sp. W364]